MCTNPIFSKTTFVATHVQLHIFFVIRRLAASLLLRGLDLTRPFPLARCGRERGLGGERGEGGWSEARRGAGRCFRTFVATAHFLRRICCEAHAQFFFKVCTRKYADVPFLRYVYVYAFSSFPPAPSLPAEGMKGQLAFFLGNARM